MRKSQLSLIHFVMAILAVWGGAGASGLFDFTRAPQDVWIYRVISIVFNITHSEIVTDYIHSVIILQDFV